MKRILAISPILLAMTQFACTSQKASQQNPLLAEWETPYGVPPFDQIRPEHFLPAFEQAMAEHLAEIELITSAIEEPTFENTILAYDNSGQRLEQVALVFGMLAAAETNEQLQQIEAEVMPLLAAHDDRIALDEALFARIKAVYDARRGLALDAEQQRLLKKIYDGFVRSGALLEGAARERLRAINEELSNVSVRYGQNLLAENNAFSIELTAKDLDGVPSSVRDLASEKGKEMGVKGYVFTLHKPSLIPFLTYASRRDLREQLYTAYLNRCNQGNEYDNKALCLEILKLRAEKARLLGFDNFAAYQLDNKMAHDPATVDAFLDRIIGPAVAKA